VKDVAPDTTVIGVAAHKTDTAKGSKFMAYGISLKSPDPYDKKLEELEAKIAELEKKLKKQ
jgi:hypothetical protein